MSEIIASVYDKIEKTGIREGILFLDEINCVSETLAPTMLQFLQGKTFGNQKVPEGWIIVTAGNPPEYNKSVREFDVVTLDRIKRIDVEENFEVWKEYAYRQGIHPAVISYLEIRRKNFYRIENTVDGKVFATARGWEDLSQLILVYESLEKRADRDVISQYIQHPRIAKDFANYLELYYKYQNEYQVEEILKGVIREEVCTRLERAPFDERLSVVDLLLAKLTDGFRELYENKAEMELLMARLKEFKRELDCSQDVVPAVRLASVAEETELTRIHRKDSGLSDRREDRRYRRVAARLESWVQEMKGASLNEAEAAWQWTREQFMERSDSYENQKEACAKALEHAFDFMETAFGNGQEMVIFITSLNTGSCSIEFLKEYECERYYHYNKELLFDEQEADVRRLLEKK